MGDEEAMMDQVRALLNAATNGAAVKALIGVLADSRALHDVRQELMMARAQSLKDRHALELALDTVEKISQLEARVGRGELNPSKTKVLHLARAPMSSSLSVVAMATQTEMVDSREVDLTIEINRLRSEVEQWKKKMKRLKEVFVRETEAFRDDCQQLLGYRIEFVASQKEFRLRSIFAAPSSDDDNGLMFRRDRDGNMQVIATSFVEALPKETLDLLHRSSSIPVFLSQVTVNLWRSSSWAQAPE